MKQLIIRLNYFLYLAIIINLIACSEQSSSVQLQKSDYPDYNTDAAKLYLTKCSECHGAPLPEIHTARQWLSVVQRMQYRMTSKAMPGLNKHEMAEIVGYLESNARK
jgi:mono/diheme cytochrome c family protein